jgi:hypothetical protein
LGVADQSALLQAIKHLVAVGVKFKSFTEPDIGNQVTAVATAPISGEVRKHFRKYPLLTIGGPSLLAKEAVNA